MSHIHEALKKAQKDRDVRSLKYGGILAASERKRRILSRKTFRWAFPLIIVIFLAFFHDSWLDFTASQTPETSEKDKERFQSPPKGLGPAKPQEMGLPRPGAKGLKDSLLLIFAFSISFISDRRGSHTMLLFPKALGPHSIRP